MPRVRKANNTDAIAFFVVLLGPIFFIFWEQIEFIRISTQTA